MELYLETKDYSVTGESFKLLYDRDRNLLVTDPVPKNLKKYYLSNSYISHTDSRKSFSDKCYQLVKRYTLWRKLKWIDGIAKNEMSVLDIGAGTGDFLRLARRKGWKYEGVEPNPLARGLASEKGLSLYPALQNVPRNEFQVITLWHVLEHLPDLDEQIPHLLEYLKTEGSLFIAVPNYKSYDATYYKEFWAAYDVPRHLWHFSRASIKTIFNKHGMNIVEVKPMIFDAFYVALLSEKYKKRKFPFLRALAIGLRSNLSAMRTKEYSSLCYIIKRA